MSRVETSLEAQISEKVGEVRTDTFDLSFGEIVNLHANSELVIQPDYQRLFRWDTIQKSRLIKSILVTTQPFSTVILGLPDGDPLDATPGIE